MTWAQADDITIATTNISGPVYDFERWFGEQSELSVKSKVFKNANGL